LGASAWKIRAGLGIQTLKNCLASFAPVKVGFQGRHVAATLVSPTILIIIPGSGKKGVEDRWHGRLQGWHGQGGLVERGCRKRDATQTLGLFVAGEGGGCRGDGRCWQSPVTHAVGHDRIGGLVRRLRDQDRVFILCSAVDMVNIVGTVVRIVNAFPAKREFSFVAVFRSLFLNPR